MSLLADAYQAIADKAAVEALAAYEASKASAASAKGKPLQRDPGFKTTTYERYPDHVHDPLKVQLEIGSVKKAALQCVTELYRGLLYGILVYCHAKRGL